MAQNDAGDDEKIDGILAQTRADLAGHDGQDAARVLAQRLDQAGLPASDDDVAALLERLRS